MRSSGRKRRSSRRRMTEVRSSFVLSQIGHYFRLTSIHGLKYIVMAARRKRFAESSVWAVTCSACVAWTVMLSYTSWDRFSRSPTITSVESTSHPVWTIPFPAVTLCNANKIHRPAAVALAESIRDNLGLNINWTLSYLRQLPTLVRPEKVNLSHAQTVAKSLRKMGYGPEALMMKLNPPCDRLLLRCSWLGDERNCTELFQTIKAMDGFCCSFNYHAAKEKLSLSDMMTSSGDDSESGTEAVSEAVGDSDQKDEGEDEVELPSLIPIDKEIIIHVSGSGINLGLTVIVDVQPQNYFASAHSFYGTKVLIHDPTDFPETTVASALVSTGEESWISVAPSFVESTNAVRSIEISRRQCLFEDELQLSSTKTYSFQTCITECRARYLAKLCHCLPFFYPSLYNLSTCTLLDVPCLRKYRRVVASTRPPEGAAGFSNSWLEGMECRECLPTCSERSYSVASLLKAPIVAQRSKFAATDAAFTKQYDMTNRSVIHVYLNDIYCIKYRRDAVMTWDALLAAIGGIFGLCLGGSAISIVELLYFFCMGLWKKMSATRCAKRQKRKPRSKNAAVAPYPSLFLP